MVSTGKKVVEGVKDKVGEAKENILEWWKSRKTFKTKVGEQHTLFFEGEGKNAKLIMQSDRIAVRAFLAEARSNPENVNYVQNAEKILSRIEILQDKLPDKITGKRKTKEINSNREQEYLELKQLLMDLAATLSYIQVGNKDKEFPPVIYPPFVNNVKASDDTKVAYLSMAERKGFKEGLEKTSETVAGWKKIKEYEIQQKMGGTYVRIHLIPACLGGYGTDSNLTPREQTLNSQLRDKVEQPAKEAIEDKKTMIWYEVRIEYKHPEADYLNFISNISVQWGYYEFKQGKWDRNGKVPENKKAPRTINQLVPRRILKLKR